MIIEPYPEVEFRDGIRVVPPHVEVMLRSIETYRYTFSEAIELANKKLTRDYLDKAQRDAISGHFREHR